MNKSALETVDDFIKDLEPKSTSHSDTNQLKVNQNGSGNINKKQKSSSYDLDPMDPASYSDIPR